MFKNKIKKENTHTHTWITVLPVDFFLPTKKGKWNHKTQQTNDFIYIFYETENKEKGNSGSN